jgi:hypothetical protein
MEKQGLERLTIPELGCGLDGQYIGQICALIGRIFSASTIRIVMFHYSQHEFSRGLVPCAGVAEAGDAIAE